MMFVQLPKIIETGVSPVDVDMRKVYGIRKKKKNKNNS